MYLFLGFQPFSLAGRSRFSQYCPFPVSSGSRFVVTPSLGSLDRPVHVLDCSFFLCLLIFFSFWRYATNPCRAAFDNPPDDCNLVATTENHRPSDSFRRAFQPRSQAGSLLIQAWSIVSVTKTGGSEKLVETPFSTTAHLEVVVIFSPATIHNTALSFWHQWWISHAFDFKKASKVLERRG